MNSVRIILPSAIAVLCLGLIISGCDDCDCPSVPEQDSPTLQELLTAPDTLVVDSLRFVLSTQLARDFMPICPPEGRPLAGLLTVSVLDHQALLLGIHVPTAWVINAGEVWEVEPMRYAYSDDPAQCYELLGLISDGPLWGPEIYVDVVVRIADGKGRAFLLRAPHQWIEKLM